MTLPTVAGLPSLTASVCLAGAVDDEMLQAFRTQLQAALADESPLVFELSTTGGDADIGRRLALEIRLLQQHGGHDVYFLGKSTVYSAGVTFMAAFPAANRYITADCVLLIHERRMEKKLNLTGALRACEAMTKDVLAEIVNSRELERDGFRELVEGTKLSMDQLMMRVDDANWYVRAAEAQRLGLIAGVI